mmetsp:Transcript_3942/g.7538  ORF Transcript_3942/g.7538 Transcript_3942/m.7538 type:complete len:351 (-) Transcript_3942:155-1207(-)
MFRFLFTVGAVVALPVSLTRTAGSVLMEQAPDTGGAAQGGAAQGGAAPAAAPPAIIGPPPTPLPPAVLSPTSWKPTTTPPTPPTLPPTPAAPKLTAIQKLSLKRVLDLFGVSGDDTSANDVSKGCSGLPIKVFMMWQRKAKLAEKLKEMETDVEHSREDFLTTIGQDFSLSKSRDKVTDYMAKLDEVKMLKAVAKHTNARLLKILRGCSTDAPRIPESHYLEDEDEKYEEREEKELNEKIYKENISHRVVKLVERAITERWKNNNEGKSAETQKKEKSIQELDGHLDAEGIPVEGGATDQLQQQEDPLEADATVSAIAESQTDTAADPVPPPPAAATAATALPPAGSSLA